MRSSQKLGCDNVDQWFALPEIVLHMDRTALAVRLTWAHRRKAGVNRLQHLLIVRSDGGRLFEAPHAAVGARVLLDVAQFGAGQFDVLSLRETVLGRLQQYL